MERRVPEVNRYLSPLCRLLARLFSPGRMDTVLFACEQAC